jgi:Flp pilus assembly protein TadB
MLKFCVTLTLTVFLFLGSFESAAIAATKSSKKGKSKSSKSISAKNTKKGKKTKLAKLKKRRGKKQRYSQRRRSGTGPDLRALTTESPYDDLDNGVNAVETKPGL